MIEKNGVPYQIKLIKEDVHEIRESLASAVISLTISIGNLSSQVEYLASKIDIATKAQKRSIQVEIVGLMFVIILGVLFGKEAIEWFFGRDLVR